MQTPQGLGSKNGLSSLEHDIDEHDELGGEEESAFRGFMNGIPARIAAKTAQNVSSFARDLPKQMKDAPLVTVSVGAGIVGLAVALFVVPYALAPSPRIKRVQKLIGKKNYKMLKRQLRALGL